MKRDMDLIRAVLLRAQQGDPNGVVQGYTEEEVKYHRALAIEKQLLKGRALKDHQKPTEIPAVVVVLDLTWEGHDFLDAIVSDTNWAKVKKFLADARKQVTIETVKFAIKQLFGASS